MIFAVLHRVPQRPTDRREIRIDLHEHRNVARGKDRTQYRAIVFNTFYCLEVALRVKSHRCTMFSFLLFKYVTDISDLFKLSSKYDTAGPGQQSVLRKSEGVVE
jgi:hypothetical protein